MPKTLTLMIGDSGADSRALIDGDVLRGVVHIRTDMAPGELSTVTVTLYLKDCELVRKLPERET